MSSLAGVLDRVPVHDVDSHVLEPYDLWTSRVPAKWGDAIPHVVADPASGVDTWYIGRTRLIFAAAYAVAGWKDFLPSFPPTIADADRAAWDPVARLRWMDEHGIHSQVLYPNLLGFFSQVFLALEPELRLQCVRAYNDFQTEFCAAAPDRLIAISCLPFWDVGEAIDELTRCADLGHRGVNLGWQYELAGLPPLRSDHWQPLLSAIEDTALPVSFHIGFNTYTSKDGERLTTVPGSLDLAKSSTLTFVGNEQCIAELILGRICHRHPTLRFVSVESGAGYIPYLLDALDWQFKNNGCGIEHPDMLLPSEYFRRQIYATFWFERHLDRVLDLYPDNFMFESDFPHPTSLSPGPNTFADGPRETILRNMAGLPEALVVKVLHDNAARIYGLP